MKVVFELEDKKQNLDGMIEALNKYHELMNTKDMNITHYEEALKVQDALFQYGLRFASFFVVTQMTFQEGLEVYYDIRIMYMNNHLTTYPLVMNATKEDICKLLRYYIKRCGDKYMDQLQNDPELFEEMPSGVGLLKLNQEDGFFDAEEIHLEPFDFSLDENQLELHAKNEEEKSLLSM